MPQFSVNTHRFDPYKNFKFRVKWDSRYVAGISRISPLRRITEVVEHRDGSDANTIRRSPGRTIYDPITLERGISHDPEFEAWANLVWQFGVGLGSEASLKHYRKDLALELYNEAGQLAIAYRIHRAWPSEYVAVPELDANTSGVAFQTLTLEHEGWERDVEVKEPAET